MPVVGNVAMQECVLEEVEDPPYLGDVDPVVLHDDWAPDIPQPPRSPPLPPSAPSATSG